MNDAEESSPPGGCSRPPSIPPSRRTPWSAPADRYRALIEAADDAILVADFLGGRVMEANPAAAELFGYAIEELEALLARQFFPDDDADVSHVFEELFLLERATHPNLRMRRKDGSTFWAEMRAKAFESEGQKLSLFIIRDVTPRVERERELARAYESLKETQAKLVHSGKLAAIGQIAGGVAHEVNNPATFILTNLRLMRDNVATFRTLVSRLRRELGREDATPSERHAAASATLAEGALDALLRETNEMVDDNLAGIERIASIVNDLRTFSRIEHDDVQDVKLNELVDVACNLAYADIRHRARLIKELSHLPLVSGEPGKIAQVFTNLLVNAAEAIEEGAADENEIRVSTYVEGRHVVVAVQHTGASVAEEARALRDFGAGLGLSLCAEIVRLHGGTLDSVAANGNDGRPASRFEVRLPARAAEVRRDAQPLDAGTHTRARVESPRARVLVIDDDAAVLRAYRRMLTARHDVVLASGGAEGLAILDGDGAFDVVLCDVMMPQVDGPMVYEALRARAPELLEKLVFCSGGAFTPRAKEFLGSVPNPFLQKPIDTAALERVIADARRKR